MSEVKTELKTGVIGIPHTGLFHWQTIMSLLSLRFPVNTQIHYHLIGSCLVYDARDNIVKFALENNADWLLFLDSDMVIPNDAVIKMAAHDVDMITGMAFKRTPPFQPCFYTKASITKDYKPITESPIVFPDEGLVECQGFGMACCMIKMDVFKKINPPWFFPMPNIGEDLTFCIKARQAGFRMFCDLSINVGHVATIPIQKEHFIAARDQHAKENPNEPLFKEGF